MEIPQLGTPFGAILVTLGLWLASSHRSKAHIFQQEVQLRLQDKFSSWAYLSCLALQLACFVTDMNLLLLGSLSFTIFFAFALANNKHSEGFWGKRRNVILAGILSLVIFLIGPYSLQDPIYVPLASAFLVSYVSHRTFLEIFARNQRDLQALQSKMLRHDAEKSNYPIIHSSQKHRKAYSSPIETSA